MCFDPDSRPPIQPIQGGALDGCALTLRSADGTDFSAFQARASTRTGVGIVILPDVRGLHAYYEDLALRFAENGVDALAIDYFGRTAGLGRREAGFDYMEHVDQTAFPALVADLTAAVERLRSPEGRSMSSIFVIGFCFGGRLAFVSSTLGLGLAGVIGFYGWPVGERRGVPAPVDVAPHMASPVLAVFGGADEGIPARDVTTFESALQAAGIPHRVVTFDDAPHAFFDRKADEFARASEQAWEEVLRFVREPSGDDTVVPPAHAPSRG